MEEVYVSDVDDGLCMAIHTIFGDVIQIDAGGPDPFKAFQGLLRSSNPFGPNAFILSHFHLDHYSGLEYMDTNIGRDINLSIKEVYYPRIPEFKEKEKFFLALYAISLRAFGSETGVMEYDFLRAIRRLNRGRFFKKTPLSMGDKIEVNGSVFEVLWPPPTIADSRTLSVVWHALKDFDEAMQEDELTRKLYDQVRKEGIFEEYFTEGGDYEKAKEGKGQNISPEVFVRKVLPKKVEKANRSLRSAANHMSLAFFEDNRFLFLGDIEKPEIKEIIVQLESNKKTKFYILVTPHHGTHWHDSLRKINAVYAISSNGPKLISKMSPYFKEISSHSFSTFTNGDVIVPLFPNSCPYR